MKYALAKELRDAGFPQGGKGTWTYPIDALVTWPSDRVYGPTLEELIEACGDRFYSLKNLNMGWQACTNNDHFCSGAAKSPTEAVARLWLALNKKV